MSLWFVIIMVAKILELALFNQTTYTMFELLLDLFSLQATPLK